LETLLSVSVVGRGGVLLQDVARRFDRIKAFPFRAARVNEAPE
jgi:hypothetical protein